jgi:hypothetical protein
LGKRFASAVSIATFAPEPTQSLLPWIQFVLSNPEIYCFVASGVVLFLVLYIVFFASRQALRGRIRRAISAKKFSESFLPEILDYT